MGNLERIVASLAQQLPSASERSVLVAAVRAAAEALPDSSAKTRARLAKLEDACVEQLHEALQQRGDREKQAAEEAKAAQPGGELEEGGEDAQPSGKGTTDLYADADTDTPLACIRHCAKLLQEGLMGLRPVRRAEDAMGGLLALIPDSDEDGTRGFGLDAVESCMQLVPVARALLCGSDRDDSPLWRRFLGLVLGSPLRLGKLKQRSADTAAEVSRRLSGVIVLSASPGAARSALRFVLAGAGPGLARSALACLASLLPPVVDAGYSARVFEGQTFTRGDLTGLLQAVRVTALCRAEGVGLQFALAEARDTLHRALEKRVSASALAPELLRLAQSPEGPKGKLLRRLEGLAKGRGEVASVAVDLVEAMAASLAPASLEAVASNCGLPIGEDEDFDVRAAAAKARGDLFFEDTGGNVPGLGVAEPGERAGADGADAAAAAVVSAGIFGHIEGLEALRPKGAEEAPGDLQPEAEAEEPEAAGSKEEPGEEEPIEEEEGGSAKARKAKRRRRGKQSTQAS